MPALVTPLRDDETLNISVLRQLIDGLLAQGADGFYIGGATGEGIALSREVRECLTEEAIGHVRGRKPCIVHIASTDFREAVELAKHAERAGAAAISAIPPLFYHYDEDDVYCYYRQLAAAVYIPVMIYYNPAAGVIMNDSFAARMFEVDNITAIKWTSSDYAGIMRLKDLTHGEMNIMNGPDDMLFMGLNAGADGGIGTTYNMMLPKIRRIYDNFMAGNREAALQAQTEVIRVIEAFQRYECIPGIKGILECQGYEVGNAAFPMKRYSGEEKKAMFEELVLAGLD